MFSMCCSSSRLPLSPSRIIPVLIQRRRLSLNYNGLRYVLSPPIVFTFNVLLFDLHSGFKRIQSWAAGWPHHQHPPDQTLWQSAGTKPHKGHRALLQSAGNALLYLSEHWYMLKYIYIHLFPVPTDWTHFWANKTLQGKAFLFSFANNTSYVLM